MPDFYAPLPHGHVALRCGSSGIAIVEGRLMRHRILFWRKRWRTVELAGTDRRCAAGDVIELAQHGPRRYVATINGETVLRWPPEPEPETGQTSNRKAQ